ncbi:MAG: DUF6785 family protein [Armatimonadota bacterium]
MASTQDKRASSPAEGPERLAGLTARSVVVGLGLTLLGVVWVRHVSLVAHTCQVSEGTPSVPAVTALVLLAAAAGMARKARQRARLRRESLLIYLVLFLAVPLSGANVMRQLFPAITAMRYFAAPENDFAEFADQIPPWLAPRDEEAIRTFYEGSERGAIPWAAWVGPLTTWAVIFFAYTASLLCVMSLFRQPWSQQERLSYPLVQLALELAPPANQCRSRGGVLGQPLFWAGAALAAAFNLTNIAKAFSPQVPAMGLGYHFGSLFTEKPWTGLRPLYLAFRPEMVGLGYLVPLDILFSVWLFYIVLRFENFFAQMFGYRSAEFPYEWPQGHGAYLAITLYALYLARRHLRSVGALLLGHGHMEENEEVIPHRLAVAGAVGGFLFVVLLCTAAGMTWTTALTYVGLSFAAAITYARVRAQTGVPISYCLPRRDVPISLFDVLPTPGRLDGAALRGECAFAVLTVLNRMTFPQIAAVQGEGIEMADRARIRRGHLLGAIAMALVVGWALGYASHLTAYYEYGCNVLDGGTTQGGWRTRQALIQYERLQTRATTAVGVMWPRVTARAVGFVVTLTLIVLRTRFLRLPIHPLGLALAATFGYHTWFPIFVAWVAKALILRLGGPRLFRRATPAFLGFAIGHFLVAGAFWGVVGALDEDAARRYLVWFA